MIARVFNTEPQSGGGAEFYFFLCASLGVLSTPSLRLRVKFFYRDIFNTYLYLSISALTKWSKSVNDSMKTVNDFLFTKVDHDTKS
jgi:hypothetical protein